jgi:hypothetical protein
MKNKKMFEMHKRIDSLWTSLAILSCIVFILFLVVSYNYDCCEELEVNKTEEGTEKILALDVVCYSGENNRSFTAVNSKLICNYNENKLTECSDGKVIDKQVKTELFKTGMFNWKCYSEKYDVWFEIS